MILPDVNMLVYAYRDDLPRHAESRAWLDATLNGDEPVALAPAVVSGFVRVVTSFRTLAEPTPLADALGAAEALVSHPKSVVLRPGAAHLGTFLRLCREGEAKGRLVSDAYLAAVAIDQGCELVTYDRDFARFPGLRWRTPA